MTSTSATTSTPASGATVREGAKARLMRLLLVRRPSPMLPAIVRYLAPLAVLAGAGLVVATAGIHLHLWLTGYRHVPRLGPLFLAQAVTGLAAGPIIALTRHLLVVLGGAVYMAASAVGLILSATVGFVGIHDGLGVPWAAASLGIELAGVVLFSVAGAILVARR
ncbi:MAG TPA: hypothetical protein VFH70_12710 [Acidimicrobiales bacterium]|nr:hypothetical protein [Acidimicrobiales bacterium]